MGAVAKELKGSEEGSQLSMLHSMTQDLSSQPWYIQMLGAKLLPILTEAGKNAPKVKSELGSSMGIQK